jgi:hypothetical protein
MTMKAKKLPRTHSKIVARTSKTGPVKKNVPLCQLILGAYATPLRVVVPSHPIVITEKDPIEMKILKLTPTTDIPE